MLTFLVVSISIIIWLVMWALSYYYARRASLAIYKDLGRDAWDAGDVMLFGIVGLFAAPIFLLLTAMDYNGKKIKINEFYSCDKNKPAQLTRNTVTALYKKLQLDYATTNIEKERAEENLEKAEGEIASLKKKNEHLEELVKSIKRFDLMDLEE